MAISKQEMISSIYKRYGILFQTETKEKDLLDVYAGKYTLVEVVNIAKRGKPDKFNASDLSTISTNELRRLAVKYSKRTIPPSISRKTVIDILLKKINPDKLPEEELQVFGKKGRSSLTNAVDMYAGWIPKIKRKLKDKDIHRGKREARRYRK
ncbi:hypothetical protein JW766_05685 [Candidatus Dojkabacteria bacterium]|nr:hypothetical protein [Candidatus Dojkabacteria bacterium]